VNADLENYFLEVSLQTKTLYQCESMCEGECESYFAEASKDKKKRVSLFALNYTLTLAPIPYNSVRGSVKVSVNPTSLKLQVHLGAHPVL
jgi:hypothetical protein